MFSKGRPSMDEKALLQRITVNPSIFGGKPIIRGRRLAAEHVLSMLAAGDTIDTILEATLGWNGKMLWLVWSTPEGWWAMNGSSHLSVELWGSRTRIATRQSAGFVLPKRRER
jgi:hypothetical protein